MWIDANNCHPTSIDVINNRGVEFCTVKAASSTLTALIRLKMIDVKSMINQNEPMGCFKQVLVGYSSLVRALVVNLQN